MKVKVYKTLDYSIDFVNCNKYIITKDNPKALKAYYLDEKSVIIPLFGTLRRIELEWLYLLSRHNPKFPIGYEEQCFNLEYVLSKGPFGSEKYIPIFKSPVEYKVDGCSDIYRLIARNPTYCISFKGNIYSIKTGHFLKPRSYPDTVNNIFNFKNYPSVNLNGKIVYVHRVVAETWIPNDDYYSKSVVDHIDANKFNYDASNLRWCTPGDNARFTLEQNVKTDAKSVVTRNIDTGEIKEHLSITKACEYIGRSRLNTTQQPLIPEMIWKGTNGRFEMKWKDDNRDWVYVEKTEREGKTNNQTTITFKNGDDVRVYNNRIDASNDLLNGAYTNGFEMLTKKIKEIYPNANVYCTSRRHIQAKRLSDGYIIEADTAKNLIPKLRPDVISKATINKYVLLGKPYNGWLFRIKPEDPNEPWDDTEEVLSKNTPMKIKVTDVITGEEKVFDSLRKIASYFDVSRNWIKYIIECNKLFKDRYKLSNCD